jgi:iduronate 2-sulfatase
MNLPRIVTLLSLALLGFAGRTQAVDSKQPNVLFLAVDDLRPQLHCYGQERIHSPNIDRLAAGGVLFERAYCMVPTCGASRASLMTGIRPTPKRFLSYQTWAEKDAPGITTMNTHFKRHGYYTLSLGKVFHHPTDQKVGWSEPAWRPRAGRAYHLPENQTLDRQRGKELGSRGRGPAYEAADGPESSYPDGMIAAKAIASLHQLKEGKEPFFLAVGFLKPHLPFVCPRKYWDLYDHSQIRLPATYHRPKNAPDQAIHNFGELRAYARIPARGPVSNETARNLIHGYYACVSFTDAQIGKVLGELDKLGLADNTIVVLWGDHGWNLGEHTLWCKHCCFETSMRIPLIIRAPGIKAGRTATLAESIDLYPTLCQLAGLPLPSHLQGTSLLPVLKDPSTAGKGFAIGRFGRGDTIRTDRHRFTEYSNPAGTAIANMLYDHVNDPAEDNNIAVEAKHAATVKELSGQLRKTLKGIK